MKTLLKGRIERVKSSENWYYCTIKHLNNKGGERIASGYGTTHMRALENALQEIKQFAPYIK